MMNFIAKSGGNKYIYNWGEIEGIIYTKVNDFCNLMETAGIPKPYNVFVILLNAKGKQAITNQFNDLSRPLPRDIIKSIPAYISEDSTLKESLVPLFDSLANSFGLEKSHFMKNTSF